VLTPCDAAETRQAVRAAAKIDGPVYIRVLRHPVPDLIDANAAFELGTFRILREGTDLAIAAHGALVETAMNAAEKLAAAGISAKVVNVATMKPFDYAGFADLANGVKAVVTAEDHNYIGGLASAASLALRQSAIPMDYVAIDDMFGQSAHSVAELMTHYGLTEDAIMEKAKRLLRV